MKTLFLLLAAASILPACMTQQDKLNWEQTVSWYKGSEPATGVSQEAAAPAVEESAPTVEAKAGQDKDEVESQAAPESK